MRVAAARAAATEWMRDNLTREPAFRGAFFSGSTITMPDDAELPVASDVDVLVVLDGPLPPTKPGKFRYRGALLEISYLPTDQLASVDEVLGIHYLANSLRTDTIIADPTGRLRALHEQVSARFAEPGQVRRRYREVLRRITLMLDALDESAPWQDQVTTWLFGTGVTTHAVLVAALRNPTVRLRYHAAREALVERGHPGLYPELLELQGSAHWTPQQTNHHLDALERTFDATVPVPRSPYRFNSDITTAARPVAIDGCRELIARGDHREAVFWIIATFARCHTILTADAPELRQEHAPAFRAAVADLGISTFDDMRRRAAAVRDFLPRLAGVCEEILETNPG